MGVQGFLRRGGRTTGYAVRGRGSIRTAKHCGGIRLGERRETMKKEPVAPIAPPLPNDLGAERAVLGSILLDNAIAPEVYSLVSAGEFLLTSHQKIFRAMQALSLADRPIDQVTLLDQLGPENEEIARMDVLGQTVAGLPKSRNFAQYAKIVREKALLRRLIYFTEGLQKEAMNGGGERGAKLLLER